MSGGVQLLISMMIWASASFANPINSPFSSRTFDVRSIGHS